MTSPTLKDRLQDELKAKPIEKAVPDNIWETIHATWTGLWTDAYGEWDERQPSDIYPITDLLSAQAEERLLKNVTSHIAADVEGLIPEEDKNCCSAGECIHPTDHAIGFSQGYNQALADIKAALARYMKGTE